jgi:hypothetical protein
MTPSVMYQNIHDPVGTSVPEYSWPCRCVYQNINYPVDMGVLE